MAEEKEIDFLDSSLRQEPARTDQRFGINDGNTHTQTDPEKRAYTTTIGQPEE